MSAKAFSNNFILSRLEITTSTSGRLLLAYDTYDKDICPESCDAFVRCDQYQDSWRGGNISPTITIVRIYIYIYLIVVVVVTCHQQQLFSFFFCK